ncbi:uncharacterized protein EI90DRAFT_3115695 [Cantharellus anzutake]|uniref:uncharacterized protein n=1 Tax=Cantharellus anzutake TaxID=1750568 RepID=UPI001906156E|nr:uncharacterized protein EI90DRAFT_3115695 [Cantharellus anzutake]KAF8343179.1 hypothetical protein EI90DRAFT_3115695 [Cantharellus anzutake]
MATYTEPAPPRYTDEDVELLFRSPPPPATHAKSVPLPVPVVLPQDGTSWDSPFARGYHPDMRDSGIEMDDWLKFIDGLNIAIGASPPLRVIDLAGLVIGFVPNTWTLIAGIVLQTTAQTAAHILSKTLTDRYLLKANRTYFEPRGLRVRLMKTEAMHHFIGIGRGKEETSKLKNFFKGAGRTAEKAVFKIPLPIIGPIVGRTIIHFSDRQAPKVDPNDPRDATHRRIAALYPHVFPVSTDVPPPLPPSSLLDKASALQIKLRNSKQMRTEAKGMRARRLLAAANGEATADYQTRRERRLARRAASGRRRARRRLEYRAAKADRLEMLGTEGSLWIVLLTLEQDNEIQGRELVDTDKDEQIDIDEWEDELEYEDEEERARLAMDHPSIENPYGPR